jgi:hypothetical protein
MGTKLRIVQRPELVDVNGRSISPVGWNTYLAQEHLIAHLTGPESERWCDVECMARFMYQRNAPRNCRAVRKNMRHLFNAMLERHLLLVIDYAPMKKTHGIIIACKILEPLNEGLERIKAHQQLTRMDKRMKFSQEQRDRAFALAGMTPSG